MNRALSVATAVVLGSAVSAAAQPQRYDFVLDAASGNLILSTDIEVNTDGFWIGDYDPITNPGGTQTIPGLFTGSGNHSIDLSVDMAVTGQSITHPAGTFTMDVHTGVFSISSFSVDLLAGQIAKLPLEVTLLYDSFHTVQPSSIYPGGTPITLPLGDAEVSKMTATQVGNAGGTLTPTGVPGMYLVAGIIPVELNIEASAMGSPIAPDPQPAALAITGSISIGFQTATLTVSTQIDVQQVIPGPIPGPQAIPFPLPTILPPGEVANLLVTLDIDQIDYAFGGTINITADGTEGCYADCDQSTGAGVLDVFDFLCFQNSFVAGDTTACGCDLSTGPTVCDIFDFLCFQNAFVRGCP